MKEKDYFMFQKYIEEKKQYEELLEMYKKNKVQEKPKEPKEKGFIIDDFTTEKLIHYLKTNERGLMSYQDELRGFYARLGKYSKKDTSEDAKALFDKLYDGATVKLMRKTEETIYIYEPVLSLYGSITPVALEATFKDLDIFSGHLQRWLFYSFYDEDSTINDIDISDNIREILSFYYDILLGLKTVTIDNIERAKLIGFTDRAKNLIKEYDRYLNEQKKSADLIHEEFRGFLSKTLARVLKFSLILHYIENIQENMLEMDEKQKYIPFEEKPVIEANTVEKAILITHWFVEHTKQIWKMLVLKQKPIQASPILKEVAKVVVELYENEKKSFTIDEIQKIVQEKLNTDITKKQLSNLLTKLKIETKFKKINNRTVRMKYITDSIIREIKQKILT